MKKLIFILFLAVVSCVTAQISSTPSNPSFNRNLSFGYCLNPHDMWFATVQNPPTPQHCLGVTSQDWADFFITDTSVASYTYYQQVTGTSNVYYAGPVTGGDHVTIPVTINHYDMWLFIVYRNGDTCVTGVYGFEMVQVDPPYDCLPLSNLNAFPNPVASPQMLTINYNSTCTGSGTLYIINLTNGTQSTSPINRIRAGANQTMISTAGRPHGMYLIKVLMRRATGNQVLSSTRIFIN